VPTRCAAAATRTRADVLPSLTPPRTLDLPPPTAIDPASNPDSALPALVVAEPEPRPNRELPIGVAAFVLGAVATQVLSRRRLSLARSRRRRR